MVLVGFLNSLFYFIYRYIRILTVFTLFIIWEAFGLIKIFSAF
jgi:hypothetical protein